MSWVERGIPDVASLSDVNTRVQPDALQNVLILVKWLILQAIPCYHLLPRLHQLFSNVCSRALQMLS
jgi:hypothetical protein